MGTQKQLIEKIESVRKELIVVVEEEGYHSPKSLAISKKLDKLLNLYELHKEKDKLKNI
ncbi:aspartyl-phosphate phosphatase Spo0E family protein [Cerasibacillus terrae]|uniref:Aspartyl-phosphate phosphatase Spo0E family protein n=1 Tax=Cerasibacillus terrae TaxID=2498845 RepID=A0A5C8P1W7_9BACI|nr:aspartyl-phosphate phosphatase Spo0E family protein [Cerasibacillus terrae]TXL67531.1 aspartyl-phosphate phosphatase Spo0E family protein [Cerasibacillus terrae]